MFAFHLLNHKSSFYISYVLIIITPNLDNYCLYTYCGGLAVRQDRHIIYAIYYIMICYLFIISILSPYTQC